MTQIEQGRPTDRYYLYFWCNYDDYGLESFATLDECRRFLADMEVKKYTIIKGLETWGDEA